MAQHKEDSTTIELQCTFRVPDLPSSYSMRDDAMDLQKRFALQMPELFTTRRNIDEGYEARIMGLRINQYEPHNCISKHVRMADYFWKVAVGL